MFSYFLGGINFSIIISKFTGNKKDIRSMGSQNAGFSNVLRSLGVLPAVMTFVGDFLKGVACTLVGKFFITQCDIPSENEFLFLFLLGLSCCIGHMWPCWFRFKGGKGILTTWSFSLFLDWRIFVSLIAVFLIVLLLFKIISLSSIVSAFVYPLLVFIFTNDLSKISHLVSSIVSIFWASLVIIKHRSNIKRLSLGLENKININKN